MKGISWKAGFRFKFPVGALAMLTGALQLSDARFARLASLSPEDTRCAPRVDDRRVIGGVAPRLRLADAIYDSDAVRAPPTARGGEPVIPNNPTRKRKHPFDQNAHRLRNVVERTLRRLKDRRRIATRHHRLA